MPRDESYEAWKARRHVVCRTGGGNCFLSGDFLISSASPRAHPMEHTCGETDENDLTEIDLESNVSHRHLLHYRGRKEPCVMESQVLHDTALAVKTL